MAKRKQRKWSNLKDALPPANAPATTELTPRQQRVNALADERAGRSLKELEAERQALIKQDEVASAAQKMRNELYEAIDRQILRALYKMKEDTGNDLWRGQNGATLSPKYQPLTVVEDEAALLKWIHENGLEEEMFQLSKSALKTRVEEALNTEIAKLMTQEQRSQLKPGEPASGAPPPGVKVFLLHTITHRSPSTSAQDERPEEDVD